MIYGYNYFMKPRRVVNDVVVTQRGLILDLDATNPLSYSGSGNNWYEYC